MLAKVEVPYRVIDVAAGDLGSSAARKYDCEAWMPSQSSYRELTSTSNCTTFQARRLAVRYRDDDGKPQIAATLNGTLATTRWIVAILENHQQPDGSVAVPKALQPYPRRPRRAGAGFALTSHVLDLRLVRTSSPWPGHRLGGVVVAGPRPAGPAWYGEAPWAGTGYRQLVATDLDGTLVRSDETVSRLLTRRAAQGPRGRYHGRRRDRPRAAG